MVDAKIHMQQGTDNGQSPNRTNQQPSGKTRPPDFQHRRNETQSTEQKSQSGIVGHGRELSERLDERQMSRVPADYDKKPELGHKGTGNQPNAFRPGS